MIRVTCNEEAFELPEGASAMDLATKMKHSHCFAGALINDQAKDLSTTLQDGDTILFLSWDDPKGREIFLHTSAHILAQAVLRLWPSAQPTIGPVIDQGFYYDFANLSISEDDFSAIEDMAKTIAEEKFPISRQVFANKEEALAYFSENPFKTELITELPEDMAEERDENGELKYGEPHIMCNLYTIDAIEKISDLGKEMVPLAESNEREKIELLRSINLAVSEIENDENRRVKFITEIDEEMYVLFNKNSFHSVLIELFRNCIESSCNTVTISSEAFENKVKLSVRDDGCGINAEIMEHLFEPFYSTKAKHYGLGLSGIFMTVQRNMGELHVRPDVDSGTCIELILEGGM